MSDVIVELPIANVLLIVNLLIVNLLKWYITEVNRLVVDVLSWCGL